MTRHRRPRMELHDGHGPVPGDEELAQAGDFLARTALKALLEMTTSDDGRLEPPTELELSDALMSWLDARRGASAPQAA